MSLVSETARTHGGSATGSWRQKGGERSLAEKWTPAALLSETGFPRSWRSPLTPNKPPGYFRKSRQPREQAHPRSQYLGPRHQAGLQSTARPVIFAALFRHPPTAPSQMSVGQRSPFAPRTQTGARAHMAVHTARRAPRRTDRSHPKGRDWPAGWAGVGEQRVGGKPGRGAEKCLCPARCKCPGKRQPRGFLSCALDPPPQPSEGFHGAHGFYTPTPSP